MILVSLSDFIRIPFGYLLDWLYQFAGNYGLALMLFAIIVKLILLPVSAKSKKSMMAMTRLAPLTQAIQERYPNDPMKAQQEMRKLQKEEGVSMTGGCLWAFVPMLLLFPLYHVIRQPITYMLHFSPEEAETIVTTMKELAPAIFSGNKFYEQLAAAAHLSDFAPQLVEAIPSLAGKTLESLNFTFLGIDLGQVPNWKIWTWAGVNWSVVGAFLIPLASAGTNILSMFISQKMNAKVATNDKGEVDEAAAKKAAGTNKSMMLMMPLMSLFIGFSYPAALSMYWLTQNLISIVQDAALTKHYRKLYQDEDDIKRRVAAEKAAAEAEKERIRAQRRAENPDGIMTNTSKKKLQNMQQAQKEQSIAAARRAANPEAYEDDCLSGDPERPYCKGRAYVADRYVSFSDTEE